MKASEAEDNPAGGTSPGGAWDFWRWYNDNMPITTD